MLACGGVEADEVGGTQLQWCGVCGCVCGVSGVGGVSADGEGVFNISSQFLSY